MAGPDATELGSERILLDLDFRDTEGLIASYLLPAPDGNLLIETGPSTCHDQLLKSIDRAGVERSSIARVFVTHIHLDHSGGLGTLATDLPKATFYAHEAGVPHLVDPARLVASTRRAWGPLADRLWGNVEPISRTRLVPLRGGESYAVKGGRLEVLATPGHARHHVSFFDTAVGALYSGDSAGVRLPGSLRARPALPPPDLDLELLFSSLDRMSELKPRQILFSHFGPRPDALGELEQYRKTVAGWRDAALKAALTHADAATVGSALKEFDVREAESSGHPLPADDLADQVSSYELAAQGLLRYFAQHALLPG